MPAVGAERTKRDNWTIRREYIKIYSSICIQVFFLIFRASRFNLAPAYLVCGDLLLNVCYNHEYQGMQAFVFWIKS